MRYLDSHTGGEPTRLIVEGGPDLAKVGALSKKGAMAERRRVFARDYDHIRRTVMAEPRGTDFLVGGILCPPVEPDSVAGVVFFNNIGVLQMCGHGTIGLAVTLRYLGHIELGSHRLDTPVGTVGFELLGPNEVRIENVPSYRLESGLEVEVPGRGVFKGDIAWGGNWFFLCSNPPCDLLLSNEAELTCAATDLKASLSDRGITGADGAEIDHIEFFGPPQTKEGQSRNFVLCPGGAYDRSPCGTGTSAKLACLAAEGSLAPGEPWIQESILGTTFAGSYQTTEEDGRILPSITGTAYLTGDTTIVQEDGDPFAAGISL